MSDPVSTPAAEPVFSARELELKAKHPFLRRVDVPIGEPVAVEGQAPYTEVATFYFKRPSRAAMSAMARFAQTNITRAAEIVFDDALAEGDRELFKDDEVFYALLPIVKELTEGRALSVKKL